MAPPAGEFPRLALHILIAFLSLLVWETKQLLCQGKFSTFYHSSFGYSEAVSTWFKLCLFQISDNHVNDY